MIRKKKCDTLQLFDEISQGRYVPYTSAYVLQELSRASEPKRSHMTELIRKYKMEFLEQSHEAERLAQIYVNSGVFPQKYFMDGVHIALASISDLILL
jgi:hypothetical protein